MASTKGRVLRMLSGVLLERGTIIDAEQVGGFRRLHVRADVSSFAAGTKIVTVQGWGGAPRASHAMSSGMSTDDLCRSIEHLVHQHMQACQAQVTAVIERAFRSAGGEGPQVPRSKAERKAEKRRERPSAERRTAAQMHALGERFYELLCKRPGCGMAVYCTELGVTARELYRPVMTLKRAKMVRSVGQRGAAKYFPLPLVSPKAA